MPVKIEFICENSNESLNEVAVFASRITPAGTAASSAPVSPQQPAPVQQPAAPQQAQQQPAAPQQGYAAAGQAPQQGYGQQTAVPTAQPQQPYQQPAPQQPYQQPAPQQGSVPTQTAAYTFDQLGVAVMQMMDSGKQQELQQLLGQFGVPALNALPKEAYGAFATALRQMGARI